MIHLLFTLIFAEIALIMILLFKTPLRKMVVMGLDRVKRGQGPVMVKTVSGTVFLILISSVYSMVNIQKRSVEAGDVNPTDQVLMAKHLLEASLMGFSLFLVLMIDRLHNYIRELHLLRKSTEAVKKQNQIFEDEKNRGSDEVKVLEKEITGLKDKVEQLESVCRTKAKEVEAAEAHALALRKQSEGFLLEYDRLLEDNQHLRNQLQSIGHMSHPNGKKNP